MTPPPPPRDRDTMECFRLVARKMQLFVVDGDGTVQHDEPGCLDGVLQGIRVRVRMFDVPGSRLTYTRVTTIPEHRESGFHAARGARLTTIASRIIGGEETVVGNDEWEERFFARTVVDTSSDTRPYVELESGDVMNIFRLERLITTAIGLAQAVWSLHWDWTELSRALSELQLPAQVVSPYILLNVQHRAFRIARTESPDTVRIDALQEDGAPVDISPLLELPGVLPGVLSGVHLGGESHARFVTSQARAGAIRYAVVRLSELLAQPRSPYR